MVPLVLYQELTHLSLANGGREEDDPHSRGPLPPHPLPLPQAQVPPLRQPPPVCN